MIYYICHTDNGVVLETRQAEAKRLDPQYEQVDVPVDKNGLREFLEPILNRLTQIGEPEEQETSALEPIPAPISEPQIETKDRYLVEREEFLAAWDNFPLALRLEYAAKAMEDARSLVPN